LRAKGQVNKYATLTLTVAEYASSGWRRRVAYRLFPARL
jgi:hypothetical protein